ncbi:Retrovirus-related Pol polyprotein from transposon TNT 1-94 [Linum perenne]
MSAGKWATKLINAFQRKDDQHKGGGIQKPTMNLVEEESEVIAVVVTEVNLVENDSEWIIDSGASRHFCSSKEMFTELGEVENGEQVYMGNSSSSPVMGKGKISLKLNSGKILALTNVLFVPSLRRNLISAGLLNKAGLKLVIEADKLVLTKNGQFVGKGYMSGGLFVISGCCVNENHASSYIVESINLWHARLGHVGKSSIKRLNSLNLLPALTDLDSFSKCEICVEAKFARKPFKSVIERKTELLELIHTDLADFRNHVSRGGKKYYITFIDDFSKYCKVYLLSSKDEAEQKFLIYKAEVENQLDRKIKRLRLDRGGEYSTNFLKETCELNGIIHEFTAPYSPQQNGVAERKNRTLKNMLNAMLLESGLSDDLWGEAVLAANKILNRIPLKTCDKTPFELWKGFPPSYNNFKSWGCLAKVSIPPFKRDSLGPKTFDAIFIGYADNSAAFRFQRMDDRSICEYRDAKFFEGVFPMKTRSSQPSPENTNPRVWLRLFVTRLGISSTTGWLALMGVPPSLSVRVWR